MKLVIVNDGEKAEPVVKLRLVSRRDKICVEASVSAQPGSYWGVVDFFIKDEKMVMRRLPSIHDFYIGTSGFGLIDEVL